MSAFLANAVGVLGHAWLDASLLDPSLSGYRCRIVVGDCGGLICDMVTGPRALDERMVEQLATHAVLNVDPHHRDPLPLVDGNGHAARAFYDAPQTPVATLAAHDAQSIRPELMPAMIEPRRLPLSALASLAIGLGLMAFTLSLGCYALFGGDAGVAVLLISSAVALAVFLHETERPEINEDHARQTVDAFRESERRERLPTVVTGVPA